MSPMMRRPVSCCREVSGSCTTTSTIVMPIAAAARSPSPGRSSRANATVAAPLSEPSSITNAGNRVRPCMKSPPLRIAAAASTRVKISSVHRRRSAADTVNRPVTNRRRTGTAIATVTLTARIHHHRCGPAASRTYVQPSDQPCEVPVLA